MSRHAQARCHCRVARRSHLQVAGGDQRGTLGVWVSFRNSGHEICSRLNSDNERGTKSE